MIDSDLQPMLQSHNKTVTVTLVSSCILAALVCYGQIRGGTALLFLFLISFLALVLYASWNQLGLAVLLFFLPWSPLLKMEIGRFSFFTFAMLMLGLMDFIKSGFKMKPYQLICSAILVAVTLVAKAIQGNALAMNYIFFVAMLVLFPCILSELEDQVSFQILTLFFSLGIISAALSAQQVAGYGGISRYIKVDSYLTITRLSGYYGDPNFYSAQIAACLSGVLILLTNENRRGRQLLLIADSLVLSYCGLLSASKAFILVVAVVIMLWVPFLLEKGNIRNKYSVMIGIVFAIVIILSSEVFRNLLRIIDARFSYASTISDLTTKRSDIWMNYMREFLRNPLLLIFGEGYSTVVFNGKASHNSVIQAIYQFGLVGCPFLALWMDRSCRLILTETIHNPYGKRAALVLISGVILPWMSLDILFFDEFFLLPAYACAGIMSTSAAKQ